MFEISVLAGLVLIILILGYCLFRISRKVDGLGRQLTRHKSERDQKAFDYYRQIESLFSIFATLRPHLPLPDSRKWAASPDFLKKLIEVIVEVRPDTIVEASSGVTTLVAAYCLKKIGKGKILSLEHEPEHVSGNRKLLFTHGLQDVAEIIHAPLKEISIGDRVWQWYDLDRLDFEGDMDLLVIDGPPKRIQKMARYPALPLLLGRLSDKGVVLMDDGDRDDEQDIVILWKKEFEHLNFEYVKTEKGAYVIRHKNDTSRQL
jgi:predicted O-methyltransferase YrrM